MIGLIAIAILGVWLFVATGIAAAIVSLRNWEGKRLRFVGITIVIFLLPFAEEIYIVASFRAHCVAYGGITKLNPIAVNSFFAKTSDGRKIPRILAHPAIDAVWIEKNTGTTFEPNQFWLQITEDEEKCDVDVTEKLSTFSGTARRLIKKGFCFNMEDFGPVPTVTTNYTPNIKHRRFSLLLPYEVTERRNDVLDISTKEPKILSSSSNLAVMPGSLRKAIWPQYTPYHCSKAGDKIGVFDFPYGNRSFELLERAIVKDER